MKSVSRGLIGRLHVELDDEDREAELVGHELCVEEVLLGVGEEDEAVAALVLQEEVLGDVELGVVALEGELEELVAAELVVAYVERVRGVAPRVRKGGTATADARQDETQHALRVVPDLATACSSTRCSGRVRVCLFKQP